MVNMRAIHCVDMGVPRAIATQRTATLYLRERCNQNDNPTSYSMPIISAIHESVILKKRAHVQVMQTRVPLASTKMGKQRLQKLG
jgi:hypothetical protein